MKNFVRILAGLLAFGAVAHAQNGPTINVGGVKFQSNTVAPIAATDTGLWMNGNTLKLHLNNGTNVDVMTGGGSSAYNTIAVNGTNLTQRTKLNLSTAFSCADNGGASRTDCTIAASGITSSMLADVYLLNTGRAGGQTANGGSNSGDSLILRANNVDPGATLILGPNSATLSTPLTVPGYKIGSTGLTSITDVTIYARSSGNDSTGDGTLGNPYRTFARAYQDVPVEIYDTRYLIDGTGTGTQVPLNILKAHRSNVTASTMTMGTFTTVRSGAINLFAAPTVVDTVAAIDITSTATEAGSGLKTYTTTHIWTPSAFKGKFISTGSGTFAAIVDNGTNTITVADTGTIAAPWNIYSLNATLQATTSTDRAVGIAGGSAMYGFFGVALKNTSAGATVLQISQSGGTVEFTAADISDVILVTGATRGPARSVSFRGCYIHDGSTGSPLIITSASVSGANNLFVGVANPSSQVSPNSGSLYSMGTSYFSQLSTSVGLNTFATLFNDSFHDAGADVLSTDTGSTLSASAINVTNGNGIGLRIRSTAGQTTINTIQFDSNAGDAILVTNGEQLTLGTITGTANTGYGLRITGSAPVVVLDALSTVTGASGDTKVGNLATKPWATYFAGAQSEFDAFGTRAAMAGPTSTATAIAPSSDNTGKLGTSSFRVAEVNAVAITASTLHTTTTSALDGTVTFGVNANPSTNGGGSLGLTGTRWGAAFIQSVTTGTGSLIIDNNIDKTSAGSFSVGGTTATTVQFGRIDNTATNVFGHQITVQTNSAAGNKINLNVSGPGIEIANDGPFGRIIRMGGSGDQVTLECVNCFNFDLRGNTASNLTTSSGAALSLNASGVLNLSSSSASGIHFTSNGAVFDATSTGLRADGTQVGDWTFGSTGGSSQITRFESSSGGTAFFGGSTAHTKVGHGANTDTVITGATTSIDGTTSLQMATVSGEPYTLGNATGNGSITGNTVTVDAAGVFLKKGGDTGLSLSGDGHLRLGIGGAGKDVRIVADNLTMLGMPIFGGINNNSILYLRATQHGTPTTASIIVGDAGTTKVSFLAPLSQNGYTDFAGIATPGTNPAADTGRAYYKTGDLGFFYLDSAGTEHSLGGGGASGANPSATIGLTAVNGSAGTFMRSDAAPALSQSIAPTMTGTWRFNNLIQAQAGIGRATAGLFVAATDANSTSAQFGGNSTASTEIFGNSSGSALLMESGVTVLYAPSGGTVRIGNNTDNDTEIGDTVSNSISFNYKTAGTGFVFKKASSTFATLVDTGLTLSGNFTINNGSNTLNIGTGSTGNVQLGDTIGGGTVKISGSGGAIGLYGQTAVIQHTSTGETTGSSGGSGTGWFSNGCATGNVGSACYTIGDIVKMLKNIHVAAQ